MELRSQSVRQMFLNFWHDSSVRSAVLAFLLTRLTILLLVVLTAQLNLQPTGADTLPAATLSLRHVAFSSIINKRVRVADANWYMEIAKDGYEQRTFSMERPANWAFFPLFPLILRAAAKVTHEFVFTGIALSNIFFFIALIIFHKTALEFNLQAAEARRAVLYLSVFPVRYFFSLPVTESLFLLLTVSSFYSAKREHWWLAGICGALASATRFLGVLLLPALALLYWDTYKTFRPDVKLLSLLLIPTGLLTFMYHLHSITGNAFAFKDIAASWGRHGTSFLTPLLTYLREPLVLATSWDARVLNFSAVMLAIGCGLILWKWRWWSLAFYTLAATFTALSSGVLQSHARYMMPLFPIFMVLGRGLRRPAVQQAFFIISLVLLILMTILFS
jgi:hypothetical protein